MGNLLCMGLFLNFAGVPTPRLTGCGDHANHRLPARIAAAPEDEVVRCSECQAILVRITGA